MKKIDLKEVEHIASLSRLTLSDDEKDTYSSQLSGIMEYIEKLNELNTSDVEPTSHVLDINNVMRQDHTRQCLELDEALSNAPDRSDGFYRVPKIIE